ncbi:MAG: transposase [Silvanigrellales bacterium]|nr:transposase [Silvanigrellales bacterium]
MVVGDAAYDSDGLDARLARKGTKLNAPQNEQRINKTQDGRSLRHMKRRWHVEFFFAWLNRFRRVAIR